MSAGTYYLGVLCATYFASRIIRWLTGLMMPGWRKQRRLAMAHLISAGAFAVLILAARSLDPHAIVPYVFADAGWWLFDAACTYRPPTRSRMINPLRWRYTEHITAALMTLGAIGYCATVFVTFTTSLSLLGTVPISASHADVLYTSGRPAFVRSAKNVPFVRDGDILKSESWLYESPPTRVDFAPATGLSTIAECTRSARAEEGACPTVFTVGIGSYDWQVVNRLGAPTIIVPGLGTRLIRYPELGLDLLLEQYTVRSIRIYKKNSDRGREIWRLLRFSVP